jgi:hypothetical protein
MRPLNSYRKQKEATKTTGSSNDEFDFKFFSNVYLNYLLILENHLVRWQADIEIIETVLLSVNIQLRGHRFATVLRSCVSTGIETCTPSDIGS